jgi:hypothetical protein
LLTRLGQLEAWLQEDERKLEMREQRMRDLERQIEVLEARTEELRVLRGCGVGVEGMCKGVLALLS